MEFETAALLAHIEAVFSIHIPDSNVGDLFTVGRLYEFVLGALRARGEQPDAASVWERLVHIVVVQHDTPVEQVVPSAHIVYDLGMD